MTLRFLCICFLFYAASLIVPDLKRAFLTSKNINIFFGRRQCRQHHFRMVSQGSDDLLPVSIKVIGVGGGGGNALNGMISTTKKLDGVEFIAMNTDQQALKSSLADIKLPLGRKLTGGLGAGGRPNVGASAAEESTQDILKCISGADMVFVTAGMGGGTGSGAAPLVARLARDLGCLTVGVVTSPFRFEGNTRARQAKSAIELLGQNVDSLLVVSNNKLLKIIPPDMSMKNAFLVADDILRQCVIGTSELILRSGLINVDFADVRSVLQNGGSALIGIGTGLGSSRAQDAAIGAISSSLLEYPMYDATGVLFNIVGGKSLTLAEVVYENVHPDANIIIGALIDEEMEEEVSVTIVATGFNTNEFQPINDVENKLTSYGAENKNALNNIPVAKKRNVDKEGWYGR